MPSSFRTPLARVRAHGSAGLGSGDSWRMRLTSLALIPLSVGFVILMLTILHKDYNAARAIMGEPFPSVLALLFVGTGIYHTELGMRSVILDYLHGALREWALVLNTCAAAALGAACVYAVFRIGFV